MIIDNARIENMDCLEFLKTVADKSINLVLIDPPYNINHNSKWDKWKQQQDYIDWLGSVFLECERILKDNGSFYFWHNDFQQIAELQHYISKNTKFVFKQMLVWNKRFKESVNFGFLNGFIAVNNLRNYQQMSEYCFFYILHQDNDSVDNFPTLRNYFKDLQDAIGLNIANINKLLGHRKAEHSFYWNSTQWTLPTENIYNDILKIPTKNRFCKKTYLELKADYEKARYTFNNLKSFHSVIEAEINTNKYHTCEKPQDLLQKIILTSTNENDVVLDCFVGGGSTAIACMDTKRQFIGCERDKAYFDIAVERCQNWREDLDKQNEWLEERGVMPFNVNDNNKQTDLF